MSASIQQAGFDAWIDYCFTRGYDDFRRGRDVTGDYIEPHSSNATWPHHVSALLITDFLIRLFSDPRDLAERYTDQQLAAGIWFIFSVASGYIGLTTDSSVPIARRDDVIRALPVFYRDLLDRVCCCRGPDPDGHYIHTKELDTAVYMMWHMGELAHVFMGDEPPSDIGFSVLENVLLSSVTSSCQASALHGLGHIARKSPNRVENLIDGFLRARPRADWIVAYAAKARRGAIQ